MSDVSLHEVFSNNPPSSQVEKQPVAAILSQRLIGSKRASSQPKK